MRALLAASLVLAASSASAQVSDEDATGADIVPTTVTASLDGTMTTLRARFTFAVDGPVIAAMENRTFALPTGSVVTGAVVRSGRHVERLALEKVEAVDKRFAEIAEKPGRGDARASGVRIDVASEIATVAITAPRPATYTLDVSLEAPTCFFADARYVELPEAWKASISTSLAATVPREEIDEACNGGADSSGVWIALRTRELAKRPAGPDRIGVVASRLPLRDRDLTRVELSLAGVLTEVPRDLYTVIVVDHSQSLSPRERDDQRAIVAAYLRAAPRGHVQVIAYARTAEPILAGWMLADRAGARIERLLGDLPPRNGSNIDVALAAAGAWLDHVRGTRRVIAFTDERLAKRLSDDPAALQKLVPDGTVVHAVAVGQGDSLTRNDEATLAPLAKATGGIGVVGGTDEHGDVDATMLVRPTSLDNVKIFGVGWNEWQGGRRSCALEFSPIREGSSCVWWGEGATASGEVVVSGELWSRAFRRGLQPDAGAARTVARILTGEDELPNELREEVERIAHAVNSAWSLFAIWGDDGGYADIDMMGFGTIGGWGTIGTSSHDFIDTIGRTTTVEAELRAQLAGPVARCKPRGKVSLTVETTLAEIVEVVVATEAHDGAVESCIVEAIWDTSLVFASAPVYARTTLVFQPG